MFTIVELGKGRWVVISDWGLTMTRPCKFSTALKRVMTWSV